MTCRQCQGIEEVFSQSFVKQELSRYRAKGPIKTTRMLADAIKGEGIQGLTLLDIGGGVGAIQHELLRAGVQDAVDVDASSAYISAATDEAQRRGLGERIRYFQGDFVDLAEKVPAADIVTLDRVLCCYHEMEKLVGLSAARARKLYGVVYPRDTWWVRIGLWFQNLFLRLQRSPYRSFVHPTEAVEALLTRNGLKRRSYRQTFVWQVVVYSR